MLGISRDPPELQRKFKDTHQLPFPLLSDEGAEVHQAWGAWGEKNNYGKKTMGALRTTVVVGPDGRVEQVYPGVKVDGHVAKVLESL